MSNINNKPTLIPLSTPWLHGKEREYVLECLDSGWVAMGTFVNRFEEAVASYLGVPEAVAVSNGTDALHVALRILDVGPGEEILTPSLTFVATTNAITYTGARPAFLDVQSETFGLDPAQVKAFLEQECRRSQDGSVIDKHTGNRVKAIMVVHLFGHPVDMDPILKTAAEFGLPVVEDTAESLGATYHGRPAGNLGHIGCFSFNGNKIVTSGGGGMIVSCDPNFVRRARYLINQAKDPGDEFYHSEVGYNYRMSNIHAALGLAQFEQLDHFVEIRRSHYERYAEAFSGVPGIKPTPEEPWGSSNRWLSTFLLDNQMFPVRPASVVKKLREKGIEARRPFVPNHQLPPYKNDRTFGDLPVTTSIYQNGLNLPSSPWLSSEEINYVASSLISLGESQ